ncbi:MAG: GNAT family N-acetyltransferase [Rhodospirillales bacterium]|nr:GNAT family N-acetyltransferase [Rhodospirillales bacterium]
MATTTPSLHSRDLVLRPFLETDVTEAYRQWLLDPEVVRFLEVRHSDRSMAELRKYVAAVVENPQRHMFLIISRESGNGIGTTTLNTTPAHQFANFGYLIGEKAYWGGSIVRQIQTVLFDFAFMELNLRRIYGGVYANNTASHFNYKRMGFKREGVLRQHVIDDVEGVADAIFYGLLRSEWLEKRNEFDEIRNHEGS